MAVEPRGETDVTLGDKTYPVALTFRAIAQIENRTGIGIVRLVQKLTEAEFKMQELTAVMWAGINACRSPREHLDFDEVGDLIMREGFASVARQVGTLLMKTLVPAGKAQAGAEEAPAQPATTTTAH